MKPYSDLEAGQRLLLYGVVFTLTRRNVDGTFEFFLLDPEEVNIKELQDDAHDTPVL